tara:strand:+ start:225 stop:833 length:609 start_codon:yes stop_codon:yes gene_type:complete
MPSKVQICNRALSTYLGLARITSLTEGTPEAEQCQIHYDDTVQSLLESFWWSFATERQILAELTNDRTTEWNYKYVRPATEIDIHWVNNAQAARYLKEAGENPDTPREITASHIYCDVELATCEFTSGVVDVSQFSQSFADALSAAIAANIAMPLTEDLKRAQNAMSQAEDKLGKAMVHDEQQTPPATYGTMPESLKIRGIT